MAARGDVVLVDFPFSRGAPGRIRPAAVVQNDTDNARLRDTIVALASGNIKRTAEPTQLLVDPATPNGASSGLHGPSAAVCNQLYTIRQHLIVRKIGELRIRFDGAGRRLFEGGPAAQMNALKPGRVDLAEEQVQQRLPSSFV